MTITVAALPYAVNALEPHISRSTLEAHHGHHHAAYVEKTRALIRGTSLESSTLDDIVRTSAKRADKGLFNAAAQAWNHAFLWQCMRAHGGGEATGEIAGLIRRDFGSHSAFTEKFASAAVNEFGSGWAWLVLDAGTLRIVSTDDAATPLTTSHLPLLTIDVWEHAYYLDYQYRRPDYITAFLAHLVNWDFVNRNLEAAKGAPAPVPVGLKPTQFGART